MKIAKALGIIAFVYIALFFFWLGLGMSCLSYVSLNGMKDNECGGDAFSRMMRVTHAPLIRIINHL